MIDFIIRLCLRQIDSEFLFKSFIHNYYHFNILSFKSAKSIDFIKKNYI